MWPFLQFHLYRTPLITAMVAFSILIIVSLCPVCSDIYEVFFYVHFLGVLIFLVGGYYHTKGAHGSYWIWPSFVFWASDRFIWVVQLVVFNHSYFGFKSGAGTMDATTELLSEDIIRLHLHQLQHFHWSPGQTAYLIMPSVFTLLFEAHPFTIASFNSSPLSTTKLEDQSESMFLVNVHGGFTKKLKEVAAAKGQVKVFVDGPYGPSSDLSSYNTSVFVSGGSGISYTLPVFLSVIEHVD
ncbi:FAD-binding domain-containing protein [Suillus cothurnatus]|nr:FAD-binding domain-containing protein [Suillus cothurnatus]